MKSRVEKHRKGLKNTASRARKEVIMSKKPTIMVKRSAANRLEQNPVAEEVQAMENEDIDRPEQVNEGREQDSSPPVDTVIAETAVPEPQENSPLTEPSWPPVLGFDVGGLNRNQQYAVRSTLILCDCCVQRSWEGIFDVLGRNFNDTGGLMWWLRKVGKTHVAEHVKGKDVVDAVRKAAHELFRELKAEIGRPVARW
jgi:hypothetical protein